MADSLGLPPAASPREPSRLVSSPRWALTGGAHGEGQLVNHTSHLGPITTPTRVGGLGAEPRAGAGTDGTVSRSDVDAVSRDAAGGTQDTTTPTDPRQQLLHVLSRILVQFENDASFGQRHLDEDVRVSTIAQVRSFVHGRHDAPVEPPVLCRLAQILRDDEQSEFAAILYMQQIAELSHNHDYGHVTGMRGALSEHDMLDIISSHVELCGLVKGRATTRHADEALRLATVLAGRKDGDLSVTRSRLHESAERLRQLRMAGQAARLGQQVARIDTAIKGQARDIASQPWSKANSRIPHVNKPVGKRTPAQPGGNGSDLAAAAAGAKDTFMGETVVAAAADRRALLKATSDMKEVLGLTQRVAELEQLLANSEKRAQTAVAMANRAAAAEQRLVEARQRIFLMEQAQLQDEAERAATSDSDKLLQGWMNMRKRMLLHTLLKEWRNVLRKKARAAHVAEHAQSRWRHRILHDILLEWRMAITEEHQSKVEAESRQLALDFREKQSEVQQKLELETKSSIVGELPDLDSD